MNTWFPTSITILVVLFMATVFSPQVFAEESQAFQASLIPEVAVHDRDAMIKGLSLGIWSENPQKAFALGFVSGSTGESSGFSCSFLMNYADSYSGVHWAPYNYTEQNFFGWQIGLLNVTMQHFEGFQSGLVNYAGTLKGFQLGMLNFSHTADGGVQLGLANVISTNKWFRNFPNSVAPGFVIVNWRF